MRCDDDISGAFDEPNESHQLPAEDVTTVNAGHPGSITGSFAGSECPKSKRYQIDCHHVIISDWVDLVLTSGASAMWEV